ncbi:methyltransferase type 11 [Lichtheimia corymbifera JMRC:FSU:9682]|uniref:Methyltransferase type 11 n=1 Tax=Lichtheimia corymbifera JMRC:FSU:9682 TaxID=1263082 RepID=A0A068RY52_9FUNG|nr:methyltransferase type 11 [Lichtheimia corymbifera JMRC:FSU:9682]
MSWRDILRLFAQRSKRLRKNLKSTDGVANGEQPAFNNGSCISSTSCTENTSASTTIHRYEGNRRFHNEQDVNYLLPTDTEEDDRVNQQHWLIREAFGSHFSAPVHDLLENGTKVHDAGCGPATFTLELSKMYPASNFIGTDVSPRFPESIKPKNCTFQVYNVTLPSPFPENYFGYVHQRLLTLGLLKDDWPKVIKRHMDTLKPGGWIELTEVSYLKEHLKNAGPHISQCMDTMYSVVAGAGLHPNAGPDLERILKEAGFINVETVTFYMPIKHSGKIGDLFWEDIQMGCNAALKYFISMDPSFKEPGAMQRYLELIGDECSKNLTSIPWMRVYGQKPDVNNN